MAEVKLQPLGKRILVQPEEVEEKTAAGLYIPANANEDKKPASGKVLKLGTADKSKFPMKVGDRVFFKKYSPEEMIVDGNKYLIIECDDVIAVIG
ncbi:co-chaperone GroES [bacterium]|nr:co-chaperone GroES [bacterium]